MRSRPTIRCQLDYTARTPSAFEQARSTFITSFGRARRREDFVGYSWTAGKGQECSWKGSNTPFSRLRWRRNLRSSFFVLVGKVYCVTVIISGHEL
jgi:hypothetical protein